MSVIDIAPRCFLTAAAAVLFGVGAEVYAKSPDCSHPDAWPSGMAFTHLKNAGMVDNDSLDAKKTRVSRLASERIGKHRYDGKAVYRQVHLVQFFKKSGEPIEVITVNDASHIECSMSDVDVYVISKHLGGSRQN